MDNGSACYIAMSKGPIVSTISKSIFSFNQVGNFGSIFLIEAALTLDEITFDNNITTG